VLVGDGRRRAMRTVLRENDEVHCLHCQRWHAVQREDVGCTPGLALVFGVWTRVFAFVAFFMALNFHFASGALFSYSFLTNGYGLPVLGSTLGLAVGGIRLPWSLRR
jgi:hypothetical protein